MPPPSTNPQRELRDESTRRVIEETSAPRTRDSLVDDFRSLGLATGDQVIVHTSLRSVGWINGGAVAYIQALQDVVGQSGTIVMSTQSGDVSDPADWRHPPIPEDWIDVVKRTMPAFDPAVTPTWRMGVVPELFRTLPNVHRSGHPSGSFAAWGKNAQEIVANHGTQRIGEESPVARLYDLDAKVLLVGVGHNRNTCFHLSEYRAKSTRLVPETLPLVVDGEVEWTEIMEIEFMDDQTLFKVGDDFEANAEVKLGVVGSAECRLFSVRDCVDFGVEWLDRDVGA